MSWLTARTTSLSTSRSSESEYNDAQRRATPTPPLLYTHTHLLRYSVDAAACSADRSISVKYNMFDPANLDDDGLPLTIRAVFVICPLKKIKLILRATPGFLLAFRGRSDG